MVRQAHHDIYPMRHTLRIAGESGKGILSMEHMLTRALKKLGFYLHADREYPSLIKGGHSMVQIDFADHPIHSLSTRVEVVLALDSAGLLEYWRDVSPGGVVIHPFPRHDKVKGLHEEAAKKGIHLIYIPAREKAFEVAGTELVTNMFMAGFLWKLYGFDIESILNEVRAEFKSKPKMLELDVKCVKMGWEMDGDLDGAQGEIKMEVTVPKIPAHPEWVVMDGNRALSLGAVAAGVRAYYAYPMSPASSILTYLAQFAGKTGMVVKQAEDEITAAQMALGSMYMGTRALTATSGGGYDLMTETVSLAGMTETPMVVIVAQRPGPATGLPTWTAQGDLQLAIHSAHGEFPRLVLAVSDVDGCYELIQHAFNYAEVYQIPVIVLTEKQIAESIFMTAPFKPNVVPIERGLVTEPEALKKVTASQRFQVTESGVSKRWLPGSGASPYYANSDEHWENGVLTEDGDKAGAMMEKRLRKLSSLAEALPEPRALGRPKGAEVSFVGWGSTKNLMKDVIYEAEQAGLAVNYLHFDYLYPLKTERLDQFFRENKKVCLMEGNYFGQLGQLIEEKTDWHFYKKFLRYNGRPFRLEEVMGFVKEHCTVARRL